MATLTKGYTFGSTEMVTSAKLSALVDDGTCTAIVNADVDAAAAIVGSKLDLSEPGIIGGTTPAAITGTTITANTGFTGDLTGTASIATNIAGGAGGSVPYQSAANTTALLANGSAGQVLTSAGTTSAPTWETPAAASNPTGTIIMWPTTTPPSGYLLCDGSAVSRTTYSDLNTLLAAVGGAGAYAYGNGDGSTTFNVPDMTGRVPVGLDSGGSRVTAATALAAASGDEDGTVAAHTHSIPTLNATSGGGAQGLAAGATGVTYIGSAQAGTPGVTGSTGGTTGGNMPPYLTINYCIKT